MQNQHSLNSEQWKYKIQDHWVNPTKTFQASGKNAWILKKTVREKQILQKFRVLKNSLGL